MILNLNKSLVYFKTVILQATDRVWHYRRPRNEKFPFAVWTEFSEENAFHANNQKEVQPILIGLDYFTQKEFDPVIDRIQNTLNSADGITFELTDIQYEEETEVIHYSWQVVVEYGGKNRLNGI